MTGNNITKKITYPKEKSNKKVVKGKKKSIKKKSEELKKQLNIIKIDENKSEKFTEIKKDLIVKNEISLYFEKPIINSENGIKNNFIFNNEPLENNEKNTIIETILAEIETEKSGIKYDILENSMCPDSNIKKIKKSKKYTSIEVEENEIINQELNDNM